MQCAVFRIELLLAEKKKNIMKKSKIVSYSSEELEQLPSESDWEANAAMTDEEILAAIADDPDDAELVDWHPRQTDKSVDDSEAIQPLVDSAVEANQTNISSIFQEVNLAYKKQLTDVWKDA